MFLQKIVIIGAVFCSTAAISAEFSQYPTDVYVGKVAKPNYHKAAWAKEYKSRISSWLKSGVNFAGKYVIATWGCGMGCTVATTLNIENGNINEFEIPSGEDFYRLTLKHKPNSRLLKAEWKDGGACYSREYELAKDGKLRKIGEKNIACLLDD